jgi:iron complex outermembrane recepter protein
MLQMFKPGAGALVIGLAAATTAGIPSAAHAQSAERASAPGLEEVIVTARKREESLQDVPVAVTAITSEALREKSIDNPYDLTLHVPSLVVRQGSGFRGAPDYFLRGQGSTFGSSAGVVTYFAGVPVKGVGGAGSNTQFFDLESVQVLKGPQGTLFGRSSNGGAVLFAPQKPTEDFGGFIDTKFGNLNTFETSGAVNVPFFDGKLGFRAAANVQRRDGFTESQSTGQELDERHRESYRLGVDFKPTEWFDTYTLLQTNNVNEAASSGVLEFLNPNFPLLRTDLTVAPLAGFTPAAFGAFFAQQFVTGADTVQVLCTGLAVQTLNFAGLPGCIQARTARLAALGADMNAELARVQNGGSIRKTVTAGPNIMRGRNQQIINTTTVDAGDLSFLGDVTFKNILGVNRNRVSHVIREYGASSLPHGYIVNNYDLAGNPQRLALKDSDQETDFDDDVNEEFQILGDINGKHNWILGYYYERTKGGFTPSPVFLTYNNAFSVPLDNYTFLFPTTTYSKRSQIGYFGQFTVDMSEFLLDGLSFTGGLRRTESNSTTSTYNVIPGIDGRTTGALVRTLKFAEHANSWTVSLDYRINPQTLAYVAHRRGFKPGGINGTSVAANVPGAQPIYDPETVDDVEVGLKADWGIGGVAARSNLAIYSQWQSDTQRSEIIPNGTGGVFTQINNVAKVRISGLELENQFVLSKQFQFFINYSYIDAKYDKWPGTTTTIFGEVLPNTDSPFVSVPEHQGTVGARYILPVPESAGELSLSGEYYQQSGMWLDDTALAVFPEKPGYQKGYDNLNLRADWTNALGTPLDVSVFARNVLDDEYLVGSNSAATGLGFVTSTYNEPRTYGLQLRYRFGAEN